jgi:hypothetical protein
MGIRDTQEPKRCDILRVNYSAEVGMWLTAREGLIYFEQQLFAETRL